MTAADWRSLNFSPNTLTPRRLRTILLISVVSFGVCFVVLRMALSVILADDFQFWHVWGWFGYGA